MTVIERFSETAMLAAEQPLSISTIRCALWAAVHFRLPMRTIRLNPMDQVSFRKGTFMGMSPQPFLASEKRAKRDGDLPVTIALVSWRKSPRIAQGIAPQFRKLIQAVKTLDERFDGDHEIGLAPFAAQRRVKSRSH
jgi:hypothetical protein